MAEKKKDKKKEEKHSGHSKGGMSFGLEVLLLVVAVFIIWMLTGGNKKEAPKSPVLDKTPASDVTTPTGGYN